MSPPETSPPIRFGFQRSNAAGGEIERARTQSRNPGAKRSIWRSIASRRLKPPPGGGRVAADAAAVGNMAVGPSCVLTGGGPGCIEKRRLGEQHKWGFGREMNFRRDN